MFNPLLMRCRECGGRTKGKHYQLMVAATPFVLIVYIILGAVTIQLVVEHIAEGASYVISMIVTFLVFLAPGLALFYYVRGMSYVCPECQRRIGLDEWRRQVGTLPTAFDANTKEAIAVREKLTNQPQAREIVLRYSERLGTPPSSSFVESVIDATVQERSGNLEVAVAMYERIGLHGEAERVRYRRTMAYKIPVGPDAPTMQSNRDELSPMTCPYCGASVTFENGSDRNAPKFCGYCGVIVNPRS